MKSTFAVILGVLAVSLLASTAVCADPTWGDCILTVYGSPQTVKLIPTFEQSGGAWIYTYVLDNTATVDIAGLTLTLPSVVLVSGCVGIDLPVGWQLSKRVSFNQLDWQNSSGNDIHAGQTGTFKFSSKFGPSSTKTAAASCNDALGFTGTTFSPVPEPGSLLALLAGIGGLVGFRKRRAA